PTLFRSDDERPPTRSERRRKLIASIVAIIAVLALVVMSVAPAFALGEEQRFNHYWVDATAHSEVRLRGEPRGLPHLPHPPTHRRRPRSLPRAGIHRHRGLQPHRARRPPGGDRRRRPRHLRRR